MPYQKWSAARQAKTAAMRIFSGRNDSVSAMAPATISTGAEGRGNPPCSISTAASTSKGPQRATSSMSSMGLAILARVPVKKPPVFIAALFFLAAAQAWAQEHACESDSVSTPGGERAYRKECCAQRPYTALSAVGRENGIMIRGRRTAQEPKPGYFLCVVDLGWEPRLESWRQDPANFTECVGRVKAFVAEQKRSAPGIFYTTPDLKCGNNNDKYLCALGNTWACK